VRTEAKAAASVLLAQSGPLEDSRQSAIARQRRSGRQATGHAPDCPAPAADASGTDGRTTAYDAFIDKIIAAARAMPPEPALGAGDIRLKGLRQ
jgi:hypothetical protein